MAKSDFLYPYSSVWGQRTTHRTGCSPSIMSILNLKLIRLVASAFNPLSHLISPSETVFKIIIHPRKRHKLKSGGNKGLCHLPAKKGKRDKFLLCVH